jgi:prepilin-type N-terminal cleavage/methylation domain-containing protein
MVMRRTVAPGFTLLEFIIAIVLGLIITSLTLVVGADHINDQQAQDATFAVRQITLMANGAYSQNTGYITREGERVSMPILYGLDQTVPRGVVNAAAEGAAPGVGDFQNVWGGTYTVSTGNSVATAAGACGGAVAPPNDLLVVTLTNVPPKACNQLIGSLAPEVYDTTVNGALVGLGPLPGGGVQGRSAVRYSQAGPLCSRQDRSTLVFRTLKPINFAQLRNNPMTNTLTPTEAACVLPQYNRVQAALAARETAQLALP